MLDRGLTLQRSKHDRRLVLNATLLFLVKMILISTMISTVVAILISTIKLNLGGKKLTNNFGFKIHSLLSNVLKDFNVHSHETINLLCVEINHKAVIFIMG